MVEATGDSNFNLEKNAVTLRGLVFQGMGQLSPIGIFGGPFLERLHLHLEPHLWLSSLDL